MEDFEIYVCPVCGKTEKVLLNTASPSMPRLDHCHCFDNGSDGIVIMVKVYSVRRNGKCHT